jgi:hypothetical protein
MNNIFINTTVIYLLRLSSLLLLYPIEGTMSKYYFKTDIYQIKYFTFLSVWYYFISNLVYALIWTGCGLNLM